MTWLIRNTELDAYAAMRTDWASDVNRVDVIRFDTYTEAAEFLAEGQGLYAGFDTAEVVFR